MDVEGPAASPPAWPEMLGYRGNVDPDDATWKLVDRIDALTLETTGRFWHANGQRSP